MNALLGDEKALWYLTRSTGLVCLVLLTLAVALGTVTTAPSASAVWPRFVTQQLHRNLALLSVAFVAAHVVTAVTEGYVPLTVVDVVVPFGSDYRPGAIGLGAVAVDLLLAVVITSAVRRRIGFRGWRSVHWAAYAAWPVSLVHGVRLGSDVASPVVRWLLLGCIATVVVAVAVRLLGAGRAAAGVPVR